jgi:hypothetical protein
MTAITNIKRAILESWISSAEQDLYSYHKERSRKGDSGVTAANNYGGSLYCLPRDVTFCEVEEEIIPALKKELAEVDQTDHSVVPNVQCDDCGRVYDCADDLQRQFPDIPDLSMRLEAGGEVPAGECNDCGALAYNVK